MRLTIDSHGEDLVARDLFGMSGRVVDLRPAMVEVRDVVAADATPVRQRGRSRLWRVGGGRPVHRQAKAAAGQDLRVLHALGDMEKALTGRSSATVGERRRTGLPSGRRCPTRRCTSPAPTGCRSAAPMQLPDRTRRDIRGSSSAARGP